MMNELPCAWCQGRGCPNCGKRALMLPRRGFLGLGAAIVVAPFVPTPAVRTMTPFVPPTPAVSYLTLNEMRAREHLPPLDFVEVTMFGDMHTKYVQAVPPLRGR